MQSEYKYKNLSFAILKSTFICLSHSEDKIPRLRAQPPAKCLSSRYDPKFIYVVGVNLKMFRSNSPLTHGKEQGKRSEWCRSKFIISNRQHFCHKFDFGPPEALPKLQLIFIQHFATMAHFPLPTLMAIPFRGFAVLFRLLFLPVGVLFNHAGPTNSGGSDLQPCVECHNKPNRLPLPILIPRTHRCIICQGHLHALCGHGEDSSGSSKTCSKCLSWTRDLGSRTGTLAQLGSIPRY